MTFAQYLLTHHAAGGLWAQHLHYVYFILHPPYVNPGGLNVAAP
jgi:hypothetical protein